MQKNSFKILPKTLLFLCIIFSTFQMKAQVYTGVRGGINLATVSKTEERGSITNDRIKGIHIAIFLDIGIGKKFALQPEVNFTQKGFRRNVSPMVNYQYRLNYYEFNILAKYKFNNLTKSKKKGNKLNSFIFASPYAARTGKGKLKNDYNNEIRDLNFKSAIDLKFKDFGFLVGGGAELVFKTGKIMTEIRYTHGLFDLVHHEGPNGNLKNRGFVFSLGYAIKLGR